MKPLFVTIFLSLFFIPSFLLAQATPLSGTLSISPENPDPFAQVTVSLNSYSFDPSRSFISWSVNGKKVLSGLGETKLHTTLGQAGTQAIIDVTADPVSGNGIYSDEIIVTPASVWVTWEAINSYVPPFYKGKSLPGEGGDLKILAIPSFYEKGKRDDPNLMSYTWTVNGQLLHDSSGLGKKTYTTRLNVLENENDYKVVVTSLSGSISSRGEEKVIPTPITPLFYKGDALLGTDYANAISKRVTINKETTFTFEPYYITTQNLSSPDIIWTWSLNGVPTIPQGINYLTVIPKDNSVGAGSLDVSIENTKKYLQKNEQVLNIAFDTVKK